MNLTVDRLHEFPRDPDLYEFKFLLTAFTDVNFITPLLQIKLVEPANNLFALFDKDLCAGHIGTIEVQ